MADADRHDAIFDQVLMAMAQTVLMAVMMQQVDEKFIGRLGGVMMPVFTGMMLIGSGLRDGICRQPRLLWCISRREPSSYCRPSSA